MHSPLPVASLYTYTSQVSQHGHQQRITVQICKSPQPNARIAGYVSPPQAKQCGSENKSRSNTGQKLMPQLESISSGMPPCSEDDDYPDELQAYSHH